MNDINNTLNIVDGYLQVQFSPLSLLNIFYALGAIIGFWLFFKRNKIFEKQIFQNSEHYFKTNQFQSFLDSTKLLTDKDSSSDAKISAIYLLYNVSKNYPDDTERVLQILNQQIVWFVQFLNEDNNINRYSKRDITKWQYDKDEQKRITFNTLEIIKEISFIECDSHLKFSNTILFNLDTRYEQDIENFIDRINKNKFPTNNLLFYHCIFQNIDFSNVIFHYCRFIKCNIINCSFDNANLWGTAFVDCDLKGTTFLQTECEGVEFKKSSHLNKEQVQGMRFKNKDKSNKEYLIILEDDSLNCFKNEEEYKKWKSKLRTND